jgi:hypothetical protein
MIEINCTNCKSLLQIDDAFAGGVCRCRHCGTIQTVPKRLKNNSSNTGAMNEAAAGGASTLTKKPGVEQGSGTGLDDLAGIVASSGLASTRLLRTKEKAAAKPAAPRKDNRTAIIIAAAGGMIVVLLGIIIFMAVHNSGSPSTPPPTAGTGGTNTAINVGGTSNDHTRPDPVSNTGNPVVAPPKIQGPSFLGQPLNERSVVYVLDRGSASSEDRRLESLKAAVLNSIRSLGPDRQFAVIFWQIDGANIDAWPAEGLRSATEQNINELSNFIADISSVGQTSAPASTEKAFKTGAEAVVLVPIKSFIEPGTHTAIVKSRGDSKAKVYCFTLAQPDIGESFRKVAADTKGVYRDVSLDELRAAGQ